MQDQFQVTGKLSDIDEGILWSKKAASLTPEDKPEHAQWLGNLGNALNVRFQHTGDLDDNAQAILAQRTAVSLIPKGDTSLPTGLNLLGLSLWSRFERTRTTSDIDQAIDALERAVRLTSDHSVDLPTFLGNLGGALACRFDHLGSRLDLSQGIVTLEKAVTITPEDSPELPALLHNLSGCLNTRYESTGEGSDVDKAISVAQKAVELSPEEHVDLPMSYTNLGSAHLARFISTANADDLDRCISSYRKATQLTSEGHPLLPERLHDLGSALHTHWRSSKCDSSLQEAVSVMKACLQLLPESHTQTHVSLPSKLSVLGSALCSRYVNAGNYDDINESVTALRRAVGLTHEGHSSRPTRLGELGSSLTFRFESTREETDLSEAISLQREAVRLIHSTHPSLPGELAGLGISLMRLFEISTDKKDIIEAIEVQQKAIKLTAPDHARVAVLLHNLGVSFAKAEDIDRAIDTFREAIHIIPDTHVVLCRVHKNLGNALWRRYTVKKEPEDADNCIYHYKFASNFRFNPPQPRLEAAKNWTAKLKYYLPESEEVISAFDVSVRLVTTVAGLEQTTRRRFAFLQEISGIPLDAAATALRHGRLDKAVEWLEQGRCLVWSQLTALRTPLQDLRLCNSALADELTRLTIEQAAKRQMDLATKWVGLLEEARAIPGFEMFLQPAPLASLCGHLPPMGFVIMLTVNEDRCDAIALSFKQEDIRHISLPRFTLSKAKQYRRILGMRLAAHDLRKRSSGEPQDLATEEPFTQESVERDAGKFRRSRTSAEDNIQQLLRGLWTDIVQPILTTLGIPKHDDSLEHAHPRIWWCPTGPLSFLPLHAAGIYEGLDSESALDYAASSYTPTVSLLTRRVRDNGPIDEDIGGLFLTNHPKAPGYPAIPGTTREVQTIYERVEGMGIRAMKAEGDALSVDDCLRYMEEYSCIHLACHGSQDASDPLRSRFRFHNGTLDLDTISRRDLKNADLAFLSACETSMGEATLPDEAVHLAAGMLAAGYRRVVGTMWSIGDKHAPDVSIDFYNYLWGHGEGGDAKFDGSLSAHALHHATQNLRHNLDNCEKSLLTWIPYVHFGY
ncbi:hypothetical protein FA13DRAFT_1921389 [Coprinellus micaceus]|uniref:CHAT domain-containing protein n=1 Tax=Coprinellus micaceus TaxID=71717 RepID=A0A4Y7SJF7_COPMI|nr:hypothetical protein FA13DRAFT_1921389 [Coprinellus micaceus]